MGFDTTGELVAFIMSILFIIGGAFFFVVPLLMIVKMCKSKNKDTMGVSEYIFLLTGFNCISYSAFFIRIQPYEIPVLILNFVGNLFIRLCRKLHILCNFLRLQVQRMEEVRLDILLRSR